MFDRRKERGALSENIAAEFLKKRGYRIIQKNFRCKLGEIDIIARDGDTVAFVEVRSSCGASFCSPVESILWKKRRKLIALANFYIQRFDLENENFRFDVVSVVRSEGMLEVRLIKDAFWEV